MRFLVVTAYAWKPRVLAAIESDCESPISLLLFKSFRRSDELRILSLPTYYISRALNFLKDS